MARYDELLEQAKVAYSDLMIHAHNAQPPSRLRVCLGMHRLSEQIARLEEMSQLGAGKRLRQALFVTKADQADDAFAREVYALLDQLTYCSKCRCANCVKIEDRCECEGCLLGGRTVACDDDTVTRDYSGTCEVDGMPLIRMETSRNTHIRHLAYLRDRNGVEHVYRLDLRTGEKSPL